MTASRGELIAIEGVCKQYLTTSGRSKRSATSRSPSANASSAR
jgi:hypothetical protein